MKKGKRKFDPIGDWIKRKRFTKPIFRDGYGRLVYPWDVGWWNGYPHEVFGGWGGTDPDAPELDELFFVIDLDLSPKRSNYERYFKDLGTFQEVTYAQWVDSCLTINPETDRCWWDSSEFPWKWCYKFKRWLRKTARK